VGSEFFSFSTLHNDRVIVPVRNFYFSFENFLFFECSRTF
ncbi:hypothetical protein DDB_G0294304, partial [Dictyostelium discoideum AX4]